MPDCYQCSLSGRAKIGKDLIDELGSKHLALRRLQRGKHLNFHESRKNRGPSRALRKDPATARHSAGDRAERPRPNLQPTLCVRNVLERPA